MEKSQYKLCTEVLFRFDKEKILEKVVLIGSWCVLAYEDFFDPHIYSPSIRTRDIDLLIPIPARFDRKVDVFDLIKDLGFVLDFRRSDRYVRFMHPDLILEFIVPERGRSKDKPYSFPELGINAQRLRFMDLLLQNTISLQFQGLHIIVPHPSNFAIHKLIISTRRKDEKKQRDQMQAIQILNALIESGEKHSLRETFSGIPKKWQNAVKDVLTELSEERILDILS